MTLKVTVEVGVPHGAHTFKAKIKAKIAKMKRVDSHKNS